LAAHKGYRVTVQLPALIKQTSENLTIRDVSLDKVYASYQNYDVIGGVGAIPYVPFKSTHNGREPGHGSLWAKMYHYFKFSTEEFTQHYHKRSNVESALSMVKGKFRDHVRAKTDTGMVNEVLAKFVCHNVCCLIHALFELSVESKFWGNGQPTEDARANDDDDIRAMAWL
jgi:transposase